MCSLCLRKAAEAFAFCVGRGTALLNPGVPAPMPHDSDQKSKNRGAKTHFLKEKSKNRGDCSLYSNWQSLHKIKNIALCKFTHRMMSSIWLITAFASPRFKKKTIKSWGFAPRFNIKKEKSWVFAHDLHFLPPLLPPAARSSAGRNLFRRFFRRPQLLPPAARSSAGRPLTIKNYRSCLIFSNWSNDMSSIISRLASCILSKSPFWIWDISW